MSSILDKYLNRVESGLGENGELLVNSSSGGLINRSQYRAVDSLLSGPAGGVVGASSISKLGVVLPVRLIWIWVVRVRMSRDFPAPLIIK